MPEKTTSTVAEELLHATDLLVKAGCQNAPFDAEAIIAGVLGLLPIELRGRAAKAISETTLELLVAWLQRRSAREPLEYITGQCRFRRLDLRVDLRVFVSQPESGPLVDLALRFPAGARVHDVGAGSGAIALAIKDECPDLVVSSSDISAAAVEVAQANAARLGLDVAFTVARGLPNGNYELVVANLPCRDNADRTMDLRPELTRYQPGIAVYTGPDRLEVIREFANRIDSAAMVAVNHHPSQSAAVRSLFSEAESLDDGGRGWREFTVGRLSRPSRAADGSQR